MHVRGEDDYSINLPQMEPGTGQLRAKTVSSMAFYAYRMMVRSAEFNTMLRFGMLSNQYWVDQYAKIEAERLRFIRNNQESLRADSYIHLQDALRPDAAPTSASDIGLPVVLPSSFTAGPRYMHERTQDAMVYVRHYGTPDLFITMTCNTGWPEIADNLLPNTTPQSRYDIVDRVFHLKVQKLLNLLNKGEIFGTTRCHMFTIGLLLDDANWHDTLREAALHAPPAACRALYITMLAFCAVAEPRALWDAHKDSMAEDFLRRLERAEPGRALDDTHLHLALREIDERVRSLCGTSAREMGLPVPDGLPASSDTDREMAYDTDALRTVVDSGEPRLNFT